MDIELSITGIDGGNKEAKLIAAAHALSERLGLGARIDAGALEKAHTHKYISKKRVNDHWEYEYPSTNNERRANLANQTELITGIKPLEVTEQNAVRIGRSYLSKIEQALKSGVNCKYLQNRKVVGMLPNHLFESRKQQRNIKDILERVKLLPFVLPLIQKYGHISEAPKNNMGGYYYELTGKAKIGGKRKAITVILADKGEDLLYISVFGLKKEVLKSLATTSGLCPKVLRYPFTSTTGKWISNLDHDLIIPQISAKSIEKKAPEKALVWLTKWEN